MNSKEVQQFLDRAASDRDFALRLFNDPAQVARELGIPMSAEEADDIKQLAFKVRQQAESGQKILIYPVPIYTGDPEGKPKPKKPDPPK